MTASTTKPNINANAQGNAGVPPTPPEARQQAGASNSQTRTTRRDLPSLVGLVHLPVPVRCAIEWFLNDGPRTQQRLLDLIEHFLKSSGLAECEERELYTDSAIAHVKRVASLGAEEGF